MGGLTAHCLCKVLDSEKLAVQMGYPDAEALRDFDWRIDVPKETWDHSRCILPGAAGMLVAGLLDFAVPESDFGTGLDLGTLALVAAFDRTLRNNLHFVPHIGFAPGWC